MSRARAIVLGALLVSLVSWVLGGIFSPKR